MVVYINVHAYIQLAIANYVSVVLVIEVRI